MSWRPPCRTSFNKSNFLHTQYSSTGRHVLRSQAAHLHFYQNKHVELYAAKEAKRLTIRQLVYFGRTIDMERLIKSANYVRTELPVRIAHRIRDMQALPYVVVNQEGVERVYELYCSAFEKFRRYPQINTLADNDVFCEFLYSILHEHAPVIPSLCLGLSLSSPHLPPDQLDYFMKRMLVSRISRRVLAEHHIALSDKLAGRSAESPGGEPHVGIIFTGLDVKRSVNKCARLLRQRPHYLEDGFTQGMEGLEWPEVIVAGHVETEFSYIREHLEYVVFELLKNAMRATVLKHGGALSIPPIHATISAGPNDVGIRISDQGGGLLTPHIKTPSDLFSFSHIRNAGRLDTARLRALRTVSTSAQGVFANVKEQVRRWQQAMDNDSVKDEEAGIYPHPRIGIGLPMSNIFATYFGGSLELVSLDGWGTDVYLRLPKLGTNLEGIEV